MRNEQPDRVPIRPFVAEWVGRYAGYTCQELAHDYHKAHDAVLKCAVDFDWDALVPNMIATWTGMLQAFGLEYYAIPGIDLPPHVGHQYREPPVERAYMRADEYDQLIEDPTGFLVQRVVAARGPAVKRDRCAHNVRAQPGAGQGHHGHEAVLRRIWACRATRLREEAGTVPAIAGMLRAPLDILADKLRGYVGLVDDLCERPQKVLAACEALMPHLAHFALATADPQRHVPLGILDAPRLRPVRVVRSVPQPLLGHAQADRAGALGTRPPDLFYAEGNWNHHLAAFAELPERSIVFHIDQSDPAGGASRPGRQVLFEWRHSELVAGQRLTGASAAALCEDCSAPSAATAGTSWMPAPSCRTTRSVENLRAMTDAVGDYGVYSRGHADTRPSRHCRPPPARLQRHVPRRRPRRPGMCVPWSAVRPSIGEIPGDESICCDVWNRIDAMANMFIWTLFLVF